MYKTNKTGKIKIEVKDLDKDRKVIEKRFKIVGKDKDGKETSYYVWLFFFLEKSNKKARTNESN
ncbi:MAG: hypothetical protein ACP5T6_01740 [Candidatus Micrarchaeia archaeon]